MVFEIYDSVDVTVQEMNKYFEKISSSTYCIERKRLVQYSEIELSKASFIVGGFIKAFNLANDIAICWDIYAENDYYLNTGNHEIIFADQVELVRSKIPINTERAKEIYQNSDFVRSEESLFTNYIRCAPFAYALIDTKNFVLKIQAITLACVDYLRRLDNSELFFLLREIALKNPPGCLLFSGGRDSQLINALRSSRDSRLFFNIDQEYEPNNRDEALVRSYGIDVDIIRPSSREILEHMQGDDYREDMLMLVGYSHSTYSFSYVFNRTKNAIIYSGQNADTIGFLGPSERVTLDFFRPRNIRMLISRIKLSILLSAPWVSRFYLYETIYTDNTYSWKHRPMSNLEHEFYEKLTVENPTLSRWYLAVVAKMRAFGCGSDIKVQVILAKKYGHQIYFPLNNLIFSELNKRKIKTNYLSYLFYPKKWMNDYFVEPKGKENKKVLSGYRQYYKTELYREAMRINLNIFGDIIK